MTLSLRRRTIMLFLPATLFLVGIGIGGVLLLDNLGRRSADILRENYVSLEAMANLHQCLTEAERLILFSRLQGEVLHPTLRPAFQQIVDDARVQCRIELANITVPGEQEVADQLAAAIEEVARRGVAVFDAAPRDRESRYLDPKSGFQPAVTSAWQHLLAVRLMNEVAMEQADTRAQATARQSVVALAIAVVACLVLTIGSAWWLIRTVLGPIRELTDAVRAIRNGDLTHRLPGDARQDEFGELALAFNDMAEQLWLIKQTDYRTLVRTRAAARATIDSFPSPVLVIDTEGKVELANPAARKLFGVSPAAAWVPPEPLRRPLADALRNQQPFATDRFDQSIALQTENGERVYLPQVRPIRGDRHDTLGAAVVLDDVTQFRLLDQLKGDFVSTVGHELKTPLTGLRMAVHLLLEEAAGPITAKQSELLVDARDNAERLFSLIEQLLALARLEDRREFLSVRKCDVSELLRAAADAVAVRAADKAVSVVVCDCSAVPAVPADPVRLGHALDNLLTNAITYTPSGGCVTLAASAADGSVTLMVTDTGVGIPPEHLPHVFEKFFRVPGEAHPSGTGLGLAIVREVVAAHGGTILCESTPGVGTTFRIALPLWPGDSR